MKKTYIVPKSQIESADLGVVILAGSGKAHTEDNTTNININDTQAESDWEAEAKTFKNVWEDDE